MIASVMEEGGMASRHVKYFDTNMLERRVRRNAHARCGPGENPEIISKDYLSVYTSQDQINFLKELIDTPSFQSLMVVGDDFQSIYGFRNTSPDFIIHLEEYLGQEVMDINLLENWRSTRQILDFGDDIISKNGKDQVEKELIPMRGDGAPVVVQGAYSKQEEIEFIVRGVKAHIADGVSPESIAVLCFTKNELRDIADALTKEGIPSFFGAPEPVMENSRIVAILSFARLCVDQTSSNSKDALICANALSNGSILDNEMYEIQIRINEVEEPQSVQCSQTNNARLFWTLSRRSSAMMK